jgi:N utilization substance protein A
MKDNQFSFIQALEEITEEKGVSKKVLFEAIEAALHSALRKNFDPEDDIRITISPQTGEIKVLKRYLVVRTHAEVEQNCMILSQAKKFDKNAKVGEHVEEECQPDNIGRIAAQTAKQVVIQRIREAERDLLFEQFKDRIGTISMGEIQRIKNGNAHLLFGRMEAVLRPKDQIGGNERFSPNARVKVFVQDVNRTTKGPMLQISRSCPEFVTKLFEEEIPEIQDGIVLIKGISREDGVRTKIAVYSEDPSVDSVGACVGVKGQRIQSIIDELRFEKIDIVKWSESLDEFITNALSPAKVLQIIFRRERTEAMVVVPDNQLSLAIGKEGQNVRLAAKLTRCKIDIKAESKYQEALEDLDDCMVVADEDFMGEFFDDLPEDEPNTGEDQ